MFRLIGLVVVMFVAFVGWTQIKSVYEGNLSGKDAISEIRDKSADALRSRPDGRSTTTEVRPTPVSKPSAEKPVEKDALSVANDLLSR